MSAACRILMAAEFHLCGIIGMAGTEGVFQFGIIPAALIGVYAVMYKAANAASEIFRIIENPEMVCLYGTRF